MAYKFQRGEAILSGALLQEGNIEIDSGFEFAMHEETILDTSRNLTVADMSGSGKLEVGSTVQLGGVADAALDVAADSVYFLDSDGLMKRESFADLMTSAVLGDNGLSATDGVLSIDLHGNGGIEQTGDALQIKALGVTNAMLAGSIANAKFVNDSVTVTAGAALSGGGEVDLGASITLDIEVDGSSIEVDSDALRVKAAGITNDMLSGSIASTKIAELNNFDTADLTEGANLYYLDSRARAAVSVTDAGGDGSAAYDSATGVITYTGPSAAEVRAHFSVSQSDGDALDSLSYADGVFTFDGLGADEIRAQFSVVESDGDALDSLSYADGVFTFDGLGADEIRAQFSAVDAGGDGSFAYADGVFTYTGPSAAEVRAHLSVADTNGIAMNLAAGQFSAEIELDGAGLEVTASGLRIATAAAGAGLAWTAGVLSVEGSEVTAQTADVALSEGYNYMVDLDGAGSSLSMTLPASPTAGDIVHVKAKNLTNDAVINITRQGSHLIDGEASIVLESPYAAVSLVYVTTNDWRIV